MRRRNRKMTSGVPGWEGVVPHFQGAWQLLGPPLIFAQMFLYNYIGQNGITSSIGEEVVARPARTLGGGHCPGAPRRLAWDVEAGALLTVVSLASASVMLIICGALVNGPYSLITTAVSADLVSRAPPWAMGRGFVPAPFPPHPEEVRPSKSLRTHQFPFPPGHHHPCTTFGIAQYCCSSQTSPPCPLPPGYSQEPEGQCQGPFHCHSHH